MSCKGFFIFSSGGDFVQLKRNHFSNFCRDSDLIIPGLVTNGTTKICCRGLILALFYSTVVIKFDFG